MSFIVEDKYGAIFIILILSSSASITNFSCKICMFENALSKYLKSPCSNFADFETLQKIYHLVSAGWFIIIIRLINMIMYCLHYISYFIYNSKRPVN